MLKASYKHIIFDLDGTLSDSRQGIYNAYYHTMRQLALANPGEERLKSLIGPPLQKGFAEVFGLNGEDKDNAVKVFREYYAAKGLFENTLYGGIKELLVKLVRSGAILYVATSKYTPYANQVLEYFGIINYFKEIAGADYDGHVTKIELIAGILQRNDIRDPMDVVMIGDTRYDIDAATELEIDSIGVSYGFSSYDEVNSFNPDYIAREVSDLERFLIQ
jgi:phosphoglycolate phosphatase